jgi:hypothetical protein
MRNIMSPATVVLVSHMSAHGCHADGLVPVTWVADLDGVGDLPAHESVVLELPTAGLESRQALRDVVDAARRRRPSITAVLVRGQPLRHRGVLAEAGIRTALVDSFSAVEHGSRRPAPVGWSCRSLVWGMWEVCLTRPVRGWRRTLQGSSLPRPRFGTLAVVATDTVGGDQTLSHCVAWAARARVKAGAVVTTLCNLTTLIERGGVDDGSSQRHGSVLRAA